MTTTFPEAEIRAWIEREYPPLKACDISIALLDGGRLYNVIVTDVEGILHTFRLTDADLSAVQKPTAKGTPS